MNPDNTRATIRHTVELPYDLTLRFEAACKERGVSKRQAFWAAVELWIKSASAKKGA